MFRLFVLTLCLTAVFALPAFENERVRRDAAEDAALEEERRQQAYEAKYDFGSKVDDQINDGQLEREETVKTVKLLDTIPTLMVSSAELSTTKLMKMDTV
uniref:Uncharacterized protein n=1 Tax=Megaselia scalaris TaxID=36166 RepID=T1H3T3_MEGSC